MKKKFSFIIAMLLFVPALTPSALAAQTTNQDQSTDQISRQQMEAQISFFREALSEFGAASPDEAVRLWIKGDQTRNGVYKYAVSCNQLKQHLLNKWGPPEKSYWIIGSSSPWLTQYKIISKKNVSSTELLYVIQYQWASSAGPEMPSTEQLLLKKTDDKWCVSNVMQSEGYHSCGSLLSIPDWIRNNFASVISN